MTNSFAAAPANMQGDSGSSCGVAGLSFTSCLQRFIQRLQQRLTRQELQAFWTGECAWGCAASYTGMLAFVHTFPREEEVHAVRPNLAAYFLL